VKKISVQSFNQTSEPAKSTVHINEVGRICKEREQVWLLQEIEKENLKMNFGKEMLGRILVFKSRNMLLVREYQKLIKDLHMTVSENASVILK
jgi:hypothetical protein